MAARENDIQMNHFKARDKVKNLFFLQPEKTDHEPFDVKLNWGLNNTLAGETLSGLRAIM